MKNTKPPAATRHHKLQNYHIMLLVADTIWQILADGVLARLKHLARNLHDSCRTVPTVHDSGIFGTVARFCTDLTDPGSVCYLSRHESAHSDRFLRAGARAPVKEIYYQYVQ